MARINVGAALGSEKEYWFRALAEQLPREVQTNRPVPIPPHYWTLPTTKAWQRPFVGNGVVAVCFWRKADISQLPLLAPSGHWTPRSVTAH